MTEKSPGAVLLALEAASIILDSSMWGGPRCLVVNLCVSVGSFRPGTLASGSQI